MVRSRGRADGPPRPGWPEARSRRKRPVYRIGGFAVWGPAIWQHSPCAQDVCGMTMTESATDFAVIAYRDDDRWEAEVLPAVLTEDLSGLIHTLRQQPSTAGTIGFVGGGGGFFIAGRVVGAGGSVFPVRRDRGRGLAAGRAGAAPAGHPGAGRRGPGPGAARG